MPEGKEDSMPFRLLVDQMPEGAAIVADDGAVLYCNSFLANLLHQLPDKLAGVPLARFVLPADHEAVEQLLREGSSQGGQIQTSVSADGGPAVPVSIAVRPLPLGGGRRGMSVVVTDLTAEMEREKELRLVQSLALAISQAETLPAALDTVLRRIFEITNWTYGEAWLLHAGEEYLQHTTAWYSASAALNKLHAASLEVDLPIGIGLPGRAWITKEPVWIRDLAADRGFFSIAMARRLGLKAAVAIPVMAMGEVVAVLNFYMYESRIDDEALIRLVTRVAAQLGMAIQRRIDQEAIRERETSLTEAQEIAHMGSWEWDLRENRITWSDELYKIYDIPPDDFARTFEAFLERVYPDDRTAVRNVLEGALYENAPFEFDQRIVRPDGSIRTLTTRGRVSVGESGRADRVIGISLDITERKRIEESLREKEERLRVVVEQLPAILWTTDTELRYTSIVGSGLMQVRLKAEDLLKTSVAQMQAVPGQMRGESVEAHKAALRGEHGQYALTINVRYLQCHVEPLRDLAGQVTGVVGAALDITERKAAEEKLRQAFASLEDLVTERTKELEQANKQLAAENAERRQAEDALRESEERFRDVLENSADVIYKLNLVTRKYDYISPSAARVFGFNAEEILAMDLDTLDERIHPSDRAHVQDSNKELMEAPVDQRTGVVEYRWKGKDEKYHWVSNLRRFIPDRNGAPIAIVGSQRDITEEKELDEALLNLTRSLQKEVIQRREVERALQSSEERYRAIVEEQTDLVSRFKPGGALTFVNDSYCRFFGKTREELIGNSYAPFIHTDDLSLMDAKLSKLGRDNPLVVVESRVLDKENRVRWVEWTSNALFDSQGSVIEFQSVGRDFTERKEAEDQLAVQYAVTRAMADATSTGGATERILQIICEGLNWDLAMLWKVERTSQSLRFEGIWHVSQVESLMIQQSLLPDTALSVRALRERTVVWVSDLQQEEGARGDGAGSKGFRSVVAFPVMTPRGVIAVIECFSRMQIQRTEGLQRTLEAIAHQVGNFRERRAAEEAIRRSAEELESRVRQRTGQLATALEALSNSEARFRAIFEGAPLGIMLLNQQATISDRNPTLEQLLEYPEGRLYGVSLFDIVLPDDRAEVDRLFTELIQGKRSAFRVEHRYRKRTGGILWGSLSCSTMRLGAEEGGFVIAMIKDITERKAMEAELRESEARFRKIFEEAHIGIALVNREGHYVQINPSFLRMLACEMGDVVGKSFLDMTHPDDAKEDAELFEKLMNGELEQYQMEKRYVQKSGMIAWGSLISSRLTTTAAGEVLNLRLVEDVTMRKITQERLRMMAHTIASMNEGVVIADANYNILSVNKAFTEIMGYTDGELMGHNVAALRAPETPRTLLQEMIVGTLSGGWTGEMTAMRKNGEVFPMLLSTSVVRDEMGSPVALVGIIRDISEQRRLQQQLAEAERKRSDDLRRFAVSVQRAQEEERQRISRELHDDICQRLSGMKLNMEVLEDEVQGKDKKLHRSLRGFKKQFEEAIAEVRRLSSNLRPTVLDDFGLVIALNLLAREFQKLHKVGVALRPDPTLTEQDRLDSQIETALYRIAQESLTNIGKHADAKSVEIHLVREQESVQLVVHDDGKGFDQREAARARTPGHGMGLVSMKERAELLGGVFTIESAPGRGTTISVTIPLEVQSYYEEN